MADTETRSVRPPFHRLAVRLPLFWVVSAGFGFLLAGLVGRWETDPEERWLRVAELALVALANGIGFWAVMRPASFWPASKPSTSHSQHDGVR